jgi:hypothetical protein
MPMQVKIIAICAVVCCILTLVDVAAAGPSHDSSCDFPEGLQKELAAKYPGARLVGLSDLDDDDKKFFQADHDNACPGLVKVDFYGDGKPTLALVLISSGGTEHTELIVAHDVGDRWTTTFLGTGGPSPFAPVVWSQPPGEYQDVYGKKKIRATKPVIVFCKYESWTILYAWTGSKVDKIWLRD